jgi:hypothetical protein
VKDIVFAKIILFDNSKGYHKAVLWEGVNVTMTEAMTELQRFKFLENYKTSLEVSYFESGAVA